tara:strand:+ start:48 stop:983 length:936 start_codon:yes stop_codon:yes gene_type:complete
MDKKMIYNIIDLPNNIKNKHCKNIVFLENNSKKYTKEEEDILHKRRYIESIRCAKSIQLATKFYISNDYINFTEDNKINFYEIKEFANYTFKKPFKDKPLLIQSDNTNSVGVNLLIDDISFDYQNNNFNYKLKYFFYHNKKIVFDINDWCFSKNIFTQIQNKEVDIFYAKKQECVTTNSCISDLMKDDIGNKIRTTLHLFFAATYLKDILPIFETKEVTGRKPFVGNINAKQNMINLPTWEHKIITIKSNILKDMNYDKKDSSGKRLHDVRGHFRHYSNGGISWITPHKRGNAELGVIKVDGYNLDFKRRA